MDPKKFRRSLGWTASHLVALVAGVLLFRTAGDRPAAMDSSQTGSDGRAAAAEAGSGTGQSSVSGKAPPRAASEGAPPSIHRLAWKALAYEGLDRPDRLKASAQILRQWVQEDWQGALDTVMKETPDDFELLVQFEDVFRRNAGEVWPLIESKRYGVSTLRLKQVWLGTVSRSNPEQRRKAMEGLPEAARKMIEERDGN